MSKYTQDQIDERIQKLPQGLQDALFGPSIAEKIFDLGVKYGLNVEQTGLLGEETGNIILGFTKPEDFTKVLQETLQVPESDAKKIAGEINQNVLLPLRDLLKSAHNMEIKSEAGAVPKTPVFMQKPSLPPPEAKPEWIIKPELKQPAPEQNRPPKVVLPESEIQISLPRSTTSAKSVEASPEATAEVVARGLPTSKPIVSPEQPKTILPSIIDLKNTIPPKLPESTPSSKVPPIDLRSQIKTPEPPPLKQATPPPTPSIEKVMPDKGTDPYREAIE
ncbi:MAG: hypothetical protein Q8Q89_01735 [bacterium]|nr:hypothetical protein [bacterium]